MSNLIWIRNICKFLTKDTCATLMLGLVVSHLDYCNSILVGVPKVTLNQLQRIQNMAEKVMLGHDKLASTNQALFDLHWLPVTQRIDFKVATMVFKCLNGEAPKYLCELIEMKKPQGQGLQSESKVNDVNIPFVKAKTLAERSFSIYGPKTWNALPEEVKQCENIDSFKCKLKTHHFRCAFY